MKVIFDPCAQNTIIRPMAQAICIARGGKTVEYEDPYTHEKKVITLDQLRFLDLTAVKVGRRNVNIDAYQAAIIAQPQHGVPVQVQVNVNDVEVMIDAKTTVEQAMAQFYKKLARQNCVAHKVPKKYQSIRQHIKD